MATTIRRAEVQDAPVVAAIPVEAWNQGFRGLMPPRSLSEDLGARWKRDPVSPDQNRWWVAQKGREVV